MRIGVDFGGTNIKAAIVNHAAVIRHVSVPTNAGAGPQAVLQALAGALAQLSAGNLPVGVAIPGEVNDAGVCFKLPNVPGFEHFPLRAELQSRLGCPVAIENDATAAALAERLFGWGEHYRSFLLVTLGTGIGGGLVLDGNLRRGHGGFAGEIGHVLVDSSPTAWPCGCGRSGCMEAYAGTRGLLRHYASLAGNQSGRGKDSGDLRAIFEAQDPHSQAMMSFLGQALGSGLASLNNALDLDALVFTGGVAGVFDRLEPHIRLALRQRSYSQPQAEVAMLASKLGEHAGVIGAAWLPQPGK